MSNILEPYDANAVIGIVPRLGPDQGPSSVAVKQRKSKRSMLRDTLPALHTGGQGGR